MSDTDLVRSGLKERQALVSQPFSAPALLHPLFWKPRYMVDATMLAHVPLLNWLASVRRPRRAAVLGCGDGIAHFALCQAMDRLDLDGRCGSIGFWGDENAGVPGPVPPALRNHEAQLYEDLSDIHACDEVDVAIDRLPTGAIDLLVCDLNALPPKGQPSGEVLMGLLSANGVLVLHGLARSRAEQTEGRGLSRFLSGQRRVEFLAGDGVAILAAGDDLPSPLQSLFDAAPNGQLRRDIQQAFRRCGQGLRATAAASAHLDRLRKLERGATDTTAQLRQAEKTIEALRTSHDLRGAQLAEAQSELLELRRDLSRLSDMHERSTTEATERGAELDRERIEARAAESAAAKTIAEGRAHAAELSASLSAAKAAQADLEADIARKGKELENLRARAIAAEKELAEANNSHSATQRSQAEKAAAQDRTIADLSAALSEMQTALHDARHKEAEARSDAEALEQELASVRSDAACERATRLEEAAVLTRIADDARLHVAAVEAALADSDAALSEVRADLEGAREVEAEFRACAEAQRRELASALGEAERDRAMRFEETAALTRIAEEARARAETFEASLAETKAVLAETRAALETARRSTADAVDAAEARSQELSAVRQEAERDRATRFEEIAALTRMAKEAGARAETLEVSLAKTEAALVEARAASEAAQQSAAEAAIEADARSQALSAARQEAEQDRAARFEEIATLTRVVRDVRARVMTAETAAAERETALRRLNEKMLELRRERDGLRRWNQELLASTSWRLTAPIRAVKRGITKRK